MTRPIRTVPPLSSPVRHQERPKIGGHPRCLRALAGLSAALVLVVAGCDEPNACEETLMCLADAHEPWGEQPDERFQCLIEAEYWPSEAGLGTFEGFRANIAEDCLYWDPQHYGTPEDCQAFLASFTLEQISCAY